MQPSLCVSALTSASRRLHSLTLGFDFFENPLADDPAIQRSLRLSLYLVVSPAKTQASKSPSRSVARDMAKRVGSQPRGCHPLCAFQAPKSRQIHHTFLLREALWVSDIKVVDFTSSYAAMSRYIYDVNASTSR